MSLREQLSRSGFAWVEPDLVGLSWPSSGPDAPVRDVLSTPSWIRELATSHLLIDIATEALGGPAFPVRGNLFAKAAGANWSVPWHQDLVVCVQERVEQDEFSGWSRKAGQWHANAPFSVLDGLVALRLHLDACPEGAGPLEVLPGSHRRLLSADERTSSVQGAALLLPAPLGAVLVMKPLLLHRSASTRSSGSRRVVHIEYARDPLPGALQWRYK